MPICEVPYNTTEQILTAYGTRLRHVHLHDNRGGNADLHLPLGAGNVDVRKGIEALKRCGYDGTITLEVFTPDRHFLAYSRDVLRQIWDEGSVADVRYVYRLWTATWSPSCRPETTDACVLL